MALNLLSAAISWLLQNREFPFAIMLALATFALANFWFGLRIALRSMEGAAWSQMSRDGGTAIFTNCGRRASAPGFRCALLSGELAHVRGISME